MKHCYSLCLLIIGLVSCNSSSKQQVPEESQNEITSFYFIRHAEKRLDQGRDPDLTQQGLDRASAWVNYFMLKDIDHILSSDYKRTKQTATPLAKSKGIPIELYDVRKDKALDFLEKYRGKTVVLFGHSNTINSYTNELQTDSIYNELNENDYDHYFHVRVNNSGKSSGVKEVMDFINRQ